MNTLPVIKSARGVRNIRAVCDEHASAFKATFPELPGDSANVRRGRDIHGPSRHHGATPDARVATGSRLDQTATTLSNDAGFRRRKGCGRQFGRGWEK